MQSNRLKRSVAWASALALAIVLILPGVRNAAADTLKFNDGRTWDGEILQETDDLIKFKMVIGAIEQIRWVSKDDLKRIIRDEPAGDTNAAAATSPDVVPSADASSDDFDPDVPTLVFIPMEDMVGTYMNSLPLREALEEAEEFGDNVVAVLVFNSGGGMLREILIMSDVIEEYKHKIRVVSWITSAISAAAMTAIACEEIYFMPEGNLGGCTGFFWNGSSYELVKDEALEQVLMMMERLSERGGYDPLIMRKMQVNWFTLSCDIDPDGVVRFYPDDRGEFLVSPEGEILTFNSQTAMQFGFGKGVAETEEELADLLQLTEWQRSDAGEKIMERWHDTIRGAEKQVPERFIKYMQALGGANGATPTGRRLLGEARGHLKALNKWYKRAEIVCLMSGISEEWLREQDRILRELAQRD
ncbi:MAG: hypothetical protein KAS72_11310 [Phycisphaerales bacterium]|nr:hypothetical protein [Phycisphaerales bacterium]